MNFRINEPVLDLGTRRVLAKIVVAFPVLRRSDRPRDKSTAAVRADILQDIIDTGRAKCAFIGTYARFNRNRRQSLIAVLAGRPQFQHVVLLVMANVADSL